MRKSERIHDLHTHKTNVSGTFKGFFPTTISSNKVFSVFNNSRQKNEREKSRKNRLDSDTVVERTWEKTRQHKMNDLQFNITHKINKK